MKLPTPRKRGDAYRIEIMIDGQRMSATRDTIKECHAWAIESAMRRGEIFGMTWGDVHKKIETLLNVYYNPTADELYDAMYGDK